MATKKRNENIIGDIFSIKRIESLLDIKISNSNNIIESRLCSLWSGYGGVYSIQIIRNNTNTNQRINLICKIVKPPNNMNSEDHERKVKSYRVEVEFYRSFSSKMLENGINLPNCLFNSIETDDKVILLMYDLRDKFPISLHSLSINESYCALDWIAKFHAFNWEQSNVWESYDIWPEGCYWRLDTRLQEYNSIGKKWKRIKTIAHPIANLLRDGMNLNNPRQYRTIIHGDYKIANILFESTTNNRLSFNNCASYDYQYTGIGYGARDLVMLIVSSIDLPSPQNQTNNYWKDHERGLLEFYHQRLLFHISENINNGIYQQDLVNFNNIDESNNTNSQNLEVNLQRMYPFQNLLNQYELSLVDYMRFMLGWGMWGNTEYIEQRTNDILTELDNGVCLTTEEYSIRLSNKYIINS